SEKNINKVTVFKADWIQHYHIQIKDSVSESIAIKKAQELSALWDIDNYQAILYLKKFKGESNVEVKSWHDFVSDEVYNTLLQQLLELKKNRQEIQQPM
ncbi:MAG: hypothetical protein ACK4PR_03620, partial [Gammaproteobacteria bacterium]